VIPVEEAIMGSFRTKNIATLARIIRCNGSSMIIDLMIRCGAPKVHLEEMIQGCLKYDQDNWVLSLPVGVKHSDAPADLTHVDIVRELPQPYANFLLGILDISGILTPRGRDMLERIGVHTGENVSFGESTIQNLVSLYSAWENPIRTDPELELVAGRDMNVPGDTFLYWEKAKELKQSSKMGIKIGEGTKIGQDVKLGLGVSIGADCEIMDRAELCDFSTVRDKVYVGKAVLIREGSEIKTGSRLMDKVVVGPGSIVSENSFIPEGVVFNECKREHYGQRRVIRAEELAAMALMR